MTSNLLENIQVDAAPKLSLFNDFFEIRFDFDSDKQHEIDIKIDAFMNIANNTKEIEIYRSREKVTRGKNLILARVKNLKNEEYEKNFNEKKKYSDFSILSITLLKDNKIFFERKLLLRTIKQNSLLFKNILC